MTRLLPARLIPKFLLVFVSAFLLLAGAGLWWLLHYDSKVALELLATRIGNQSSRAAMAIKRHDGFSRPELARDLIAPLTVDPAVLCIDLIGRGKDGASKRLSTGIECTDQHPLTNLLELPLGDAHGTVLSVRFSKAQVLKEARVQRGVLISALLFTIGIASVCVYLGFRLVVGRRLDNLASALNQIAHGGERVPVEIGGDDELGRIMQAFNDMISREAHQELDLKHSLQELELAQEESKRLNAEQQRWIQTGESERRFRDFVASASDWYWEMDSHLRFSYFSDRFTEVSGVPAEVLLGKTREETGIPNVDPATWEQHLDDLRQHRPFRGFEHPRTKSSGNLVWLSINGTPLFDDDGSFLGYRGTGSDISERVLAKDLLREMQVSEQIARTKSEFLANMSHEIRTPINGVLGMTEALLRTHLDPKQKRYSENVRRSAQMLVEVVNDILDFSKIEAGKMSLHCAPFDLRELIEDTVEMFAPNAHGKGLELMSHIPVTLGRGFSGDANRLRQVLTNLLGNAIKFTNEGGVLVRVSQSQSTAEAENLLIEVQDTGIGIAPEAQSHIFDSFAQADSSTSRNYGGTGLGLAICSQLIGLMGGEIGLQSTPERGSTFWFRLTLPTVTHGYEPDEPRDGLQEKRILIVDASINSRETLWHYISAWSNHVDSVSSANQALCMLRQAAEADKPYDIALLDTAMNGIGRLGLTHSTSVALGIDRTRRVLLTSLANTVSSESLTGTGIFGALAKPVRLHDLYRCLVRAINDDTTNDHASPLTSSRIGAAPRLSGRILLAEDNIVNQEVAIELMEPLGITVVVANDGEAAVSIWSQCDFDLVLMDCQMPRITGFEATSQIRELEKQRGIGRTPIIALTANAMNGDRERCLESGMDDYLSKPVSEEQLYATLRRWLPGEKIGKPLQRSDSIDSSVVPNDASSPILDPLVIERYRERERHGRRNVLERIVRAYLDQSRDNVKALLLALHSGDAEAAQAAAHTLKSSSAQIGAVALSQLCALLEHHAREGTIAELSARCSELERLHETVCTALSAELDQYAA